MENTIYDCGWENNLSKRIRECRNDMGLSQNALAKELNVSQQTISGWEAGKSIPDMPMLITLCNFFGREVDSLLGQINDYKTHDNKWICEKTGLSEPVIDYMCGNYRDSSIPHLFDIIFRSEYVEHFFDCALQYVSVSPDPDYRVYVTQKDGERTHITGVSSFAVDSQIIDRDIIKQAIMFRLQWIMEEFAKDVDKNRRVEKEKQNLLQPSLFTTRNDCKKLESIFYKKGDKWFYTDKSGNEQPLHLDND